jgi:SAM-dependent methyltransferase
LGAHTDTVTSLWLDLPDHAGMAVLDASAGAGVSTRALLAAGMKVTATNFGPERPVSMPLEAGFVGGVDLNGRWPFEDGSFDGVHLQEVIEHLENPAHTVRECARVLRSDGVLVLSTPNTLNAASRVRFLLTGFTEGRKHPISYAKPTGNAGNVYLTNLPQLHYLLAQSGMSVEKVIPTSRERRTRLAAAALYPLFWLGTTLATRRVRNKDLLDKRERREVPEEQLAELQAKQSGVQRRLRRLMLSRAALVGREIALRARKTGKPPLEA